MTEPAQQPPGTRGHSPAALIVDNHLRIVAYTEPAPGCSKIVDLRERMAATVRSHGTGKVHVQVGKDGAWNVRFQIRLPAFLRMHEIESTIDNTPPFIFQVRKQLGSVCQCLESSHRMGRIADYQSLLYTAETS